MYATVSASHPRGRDAANARRTPLADAGGDRMSLASLCLSLCRSVKACIHTCGVCENSATHNPSHAAIATRNATSWRGCYAQNVALRSPLSVFGCQLFQLDPTAGTLFLFSYCTAAVQRSLAGRLSATHEWRREDGSERRCPSSFSGVPTARMRRGYGGVHSSPHFPRAHRSSCSPPITPSFLRAPAQQV